MRLRTQLIVAFLCCGMIPLLVAGVANFHSARSGMKTMEQITREALERADQQQLVAIRGLKKQQIETYFDIVQKMMVNFSENPSIVQGTKELRAGFRSFRAEAGSADPQLARSELMQFYTTDFANEYRKQNPRKAVDVATFVSKLSDDSVALQLAYIKQNPNPLGKKHMLDRPSAETSYNQTHGRFHPMVRDYLEQFILYDVFLVDAESGDVIYTVFKEVDYSTSLKSGPLAQSNLAAAFRKANESVNKRAITLVDFEQYFPSYEAPASFIACPIFDGETKLGVAIFQVPLDRITQVMSDRAGMGETGETVLVGSDFLPRSDSYRDPEHRSVLNAFRNPEQGKIESQGIRSALTEGESGVGRLKDYLGNDVVSAYCPVDILGLRWALTAKRDMSETPGDIEQIVQVAAASTASLIWWSFGIGLLAAVGVALVAFWKGNQIAKPIIGAAVFARQIASGDLTKSCTLRATAESGELIAAMNDMRGSLNEMVRKLGRNAGTLTRSSEGLSVTASQLSSGADEATNLSTSVAAAAEEMSVNMTSVSASTEEMSANVRTVAAAIEEMTASIAEVAQNAERAAVVAQEASVLTQSSSDKIGQLGAAASEIGKVIEVIQDIAEQTNLLALNATIEAARAGDAGKGFAVVATEVKELAKQTASASDDIRSRIEAIQAATTEAIAAIGNIEAAIRNVNDVSRTIASAVEEQRITTSEISKSVTETTQVVDVVTRSIVESATASREITQNMAKVDTASRQTSSGAVSTKEAGDELLSLADELQQLVRHFHLESAAATVTG